MPAKHLYRFVVEVQHTGTKRDFEYFFSTRRSSMEYSAKLSEHQEQTLSSEEQRPALQEKLTRSFLKASIEKAGYALIKLKDLYASGIADKSIYIEKRSGNLELRTKNPYSRIIVNYQEDGRLRVTAGNNIGGGFQNTKQLEILLESADATRDLAEFIQKNF